MIFGKETLDEIWTDLQSLLPLNYEELTLNKSIVKLNPNWDKYRKLELDKELVIFSIRNQNILVGYAFFFVQPHIHYKDLIVATNDVLYLKKEYRQGMTGIKFLKYCDSELSNIAHKLVWHVKDSNDFKPILQRMGYSVEDTLMGRII